PAHQFVTTAAKSSAASLGLISRAGSPTFNSSLLTLGTTLGSMRLASQTPGVVKEPWHPSYDPVQAGLRGRGERKEVREGAAMSTSPDPGFGNDVLRPGEH